MAKEGSSRFKLKFTFSSFQICCSKHLSNSTIPSIHPFSPMNPKARDIVYPNIPAPPPSTPEHQFKKVLPKNSVISKHATNIYIPLKDFKTINSPEVVHCESTFCRTQTNLKSMQSVSSREKSNLKVNKNINQEYYESLLSTRKSQHDDKNDKKKVIEDRRKGKMRVREMSYAVVKKSNDPYEDFRKSMVEMIMEMEVIGSEELERLLECFLALNSQCYHGVIVRAFTEIWKQLFCETRIHSKSHNNHTRLN